MMEKVLTPVFPAPHSVFCGYKRTISSTMEVVSSRHSVICSFPGTRRQKQEDCLKFSASLSYSVRACQNKTKSEEKKCLQDVETETCNASTGVVEAAGSRVLSQSHLHRELEFMELQVHITTSGLFGTEWWRFILNKHSTHWASPPALAQSPSTDIAAVYSLNLTVNPLAPWEAFFWVWFGHSFTSWWN